MGMKTGGASDDLNSEINVTPLVDVMLVLLIIFMVAAPLLQVGVPIELPQAKGKQLESNKEPLAISVKADGSVFIGETAVSLDEALLSAAVPVPLLGRGQAPRRRVPVPNSMSKG